MNHDVLGLARQVLSLPSAPGHEQHVQEFVIRQARALGLPVESDRIGNLIIRYRQRSRRPPFVLMAHMDHPGFEILGPNRAEFLGGVPKDLFAGSRVVVFGEAGPVRIKIRRPLRRRWPRRKLLEIAPAKGIRAGDFGMWDLPAYRVHGDRLQARAIDDLLGVAAVLATLAAAVRRRLRTNLWGVFTRAEEIGYQGAVPLVRSGRLPKDSLVISVEMSKERPWARIGDGPVVRVGDKLSVFDSAAVDLLVAAGRRAGLTFQRALLDGGSCEATPFAAFGYRTAGLCLPLGNYHNIGHDRKPRAEYVSVGDLCDLVRLATAAAQDWAVRVDFCSQLRRQMGQIVRSGPRRLAPRPERRVA